MKHTPESLVLYGTAFKELSCKHIIPGSVVITSGHPDVRVINTFQEGVDYEIDYVAGRIKRLPSGGIPDWSLKTAPTREHYGADTSNIPYTIWVDYRSSDVPQEVSKSTKLTRLFHQIQTGNSLHITVLGDSISTGAESEITEHFYFQVWANRIRATYPQLDIRINRQAVGGTLSNDLTDATMLTNRVVDDPDVVIIAYGMNDQIANEPDVFEANIKSGIHWIQSHYPKADVILVSGCRGNYETFYNETERARFNGYIAKLERISNETEDVDWVNVTARWDDYLRRKKYHDLLRNDINHPNSFGHAEIYGKAFDKFIP